MNSLVLLMNSMHQIIFLPHPPGTVELSLNTEAVHSKHFTDFIGGYRQGLWLISLVVNSIMPTCGVMVGLD